MNLDHFMLPQTTSTSYVAIVAPTRQSSNCDTGTNFVDSDRPCAIDVDRWSSSTGNASINVEKHPPSPSSSTSQMTSSSTGGTGTIRLPSLLFSRPSFARRHSSTSTASSTGGASVAGATGDRRSISNNRQSRTECDDELADLPEANVDSDEEDDESCPSGDSFVELRDSVRECLEKDPLERSEDDLLILLDFMQHMPAFANLPVGVKRELCLKMVFAVVDKAYTTVMRDGEQLDSWSVIVNGEVEALMPDGSRVEYHLGDCFGVEPRPEAQFQTGQMRTLVDDCQFVLVAQADYVQTMAIASDNLRKHTDAAGEIISETERRTLENNREGYVLIKGKPEKLIQALIEERDTNVDQYYVEDFLLTYRTFIDNPTEIFQRFLTWFNNEPYLREKVARLVLLWVNNHFNDFETDTSMTNMLEQFEQALERENMVNHQQLLNIACSVKSRSRVLIYKRSNRDEILHFSILGGNNGSELPHQQTGHGVFVSKVERGLKRGDQILEVNSTSFLSIPYQKALEILRGATHLSITVKANMLGFKEMLSSTDFNHVPSSAFLPAQSLSLLSTSECSGGANALLLPRTKSYSSAAVVDPSIIVGSSGRARSAHGRTGILPPALLHHTHSSLDARQMSIGSTGTVGTKTPLHSSPLTKQQHQPSEAKESAGPTSRLSKLIKKIKHGNSASYLPIDDDRTDSAIRCPVNYHPAGTAATSLLPGCFAEPPPQAQDQIFSNSRLKHSRSNPDLTNQTPAPHGGHARHSQHSSTGYAISKYYQPTKPAGPEHVLKVYKADQTYKYLTVHKDTTAQAVVQLVLQEFGLAPLGSESALDPTNLAIADEWSLCEVIVSNEGFIKQRRLPDQMQNLAERIALNSRYYLKNNKTTEALVPDSLAPELLKESQTTLIELNANILAAQLTLQDFSLFASIEPTEYVDNLFQNKNSKYGWPKLEQFEQLVNKEMWWVATEVCRERNLVRRAKVIKKFIKVARQCRDFKNFNSMFAVVSGLEKPCVRRLHSTWNRVPGKYAKTFEDLQLLLDPSRNMSKYRQHLTQVSVDPPAISLFPVELSSMSEHSGGFGSSRINDALLYMNSFEGGAAIATMRKQFMQRGPFSRKKLYEQALMVRRVKSYLANFFVIDNENELDRLSMECEPQPSSGLNVGSGPSLTRRRQLSPSPSSASSASQASVDVTRRNLHPKFGVESPQAVQRMLALVDHSRPLKSSGVVSFSGPRSAAYHSHSPHYHHYHHYCRSSSPPTAVVSPNIFRRKASAAAQRAGVPTTAAHGRSQSESTHNQKDGFNNSLLHYAGSAHRFNNGSGTASYGQQAAPTSLQPVDLTAESSCVNILISPLRIHSSGRVTGSVTSTDSALSQHSIMTACVPSSSCSSSASCVAGGSIPPSTSSGVCRCCHGNGDVASNLIAHAVSCDSTDSGHCSIGDVAVASSSTPMPSITGGGSVGSPPNQRRSYPLNAQQKEISGTSSCTCQRQSSVSSTTKTTRSAAANDDERSLTGASTFAECHQQTMRRANSIPTGGGAGIRTSLQDEQISRV